MLETDGFDHSAENEQPPHRALAEASDQLVVGVGEVELIVFGDV